MQNILVTLLLHIKVLEKTTVTVWCHSTCLLYTLITVHLFGTRAHGNRTGLISRTENYQLSNRNKKDSSRASGARSVSPVAVSVQESPVGQSQ